MHPSAPNDPPESPERSPPPGYEWLRVGLIAVALLALYLLLASSSTLWDRDEPRFARAAVEMLESGDYSIITFNGDLRAVKPPLVYWLMTVGQRWLGFTELAFRLWSGLGVAAAGVGVYACGRRMIGPRGARWAMAIFGTSLMPLWLATAATADGVMIPFMVLAQWVFIEGVYRGRRVWHYAVLALALGLTALAKGPMASLPVFSIALSVFLLRRMDPGSPRFGRAFWAWFSLTTLAGLVMFLAWAVPANAETGGELAEKGLWGRGFISRMVTPMQGHGGAGLLEYLLWLPFYVPALILDTFPWCLLLPGAISALVRGNLLTPRERALIRAWTLPSFVIFTLVVTKLPHYVFGMMPMLSIAMAGVLCSLGERDAGAGDVPAARAQHGLSERDRAWVRGGAFFYLALALPLAIALLAGPWLVRLDGHLDRGFIVGAGVVGFVLLVVAAVVALLQLRDRIQAAATVTLVGHALILVLVALLLIPHIERTVKISPELAAAVRAHVPDDAPVRMLGYEEPSLVFYLDRPHDQRVAPFRGGREEILAFAARPGPAALVVSREEWEAIMGDEPPPGGLERVAVERTLNYSARAQETEVWVLIRGS